MSINLTMPELTELKPKITVIGVGGAGGNAVNNMIGAELQGVDFVAANTDAQALANSKADRKIQLGVEITQGLGAGSQPEVGRAAAEETVDMLQDALAGCHMTFITAGMGGGTGTGAAPVVARLARERGILSVGVVTKPFQFEGQRRMDVAEQGIADLREFVDTLIIIPNQNLFRIANEKTTFADAFTMADDVLHSGVRGITDLMVMPGLINLDFADIRTVMAGMGTAMMGTGEAEGENRAIEAAQAAISNPLLDEVSMKGAKGVIINITGGMDLTLFEVDEAANHIRNEVDENANIIVGSAFSEDLNGRMRVSVVATGVGGEARAVPPAIVSRTTPGDGMKTTIINGATRFVAESAPEMPADSDNVTEPEMAATDMPAQAAADETAMGEPEGEPKEPEVADVDAFLAPEPALPGDMKEPEGFPDAFAEAALTNGTSPGQGLDAADEAVVALKPEVIEAAENAPASEAMRTGVKSISLFERMTNSLRHEEQQEDPDDDDLGEDIVTVSGARAHQDIGEQENGEPPLVASGNVAAALGGISPEDRPVPAVSDDLEIPSFLRRQAN